MSGQLLSERVDKRVGGGSIKAAAQWQWGDAENAMKEWVVKAVTVLLSSIRALSRP